MPRGSSNGISPHWRQEFLLKQNALGWTGSWQLGMLQFDSDHIGIFRRGRSLGVRPSYLFGGKALPYACPIVLLFSQDWHYLRLTPIVYMDNFHMDIQKSPRSFAFLCDG